MAEVGQDRRIEEPEAFVRRWGVPSSYAVDMVRARDAEVAAAARREVLEACCAAVCTNCRERQPIVEHGGLLSHLEFGGYWLCEARAIRRLAAARGWLREEAAEHGEEGVRDAGAEAD